ncbi:hypothetical protein BD779DRAFT_258805 [Infundibulicybe gibba]|nr:hypothetical protein BD779DRAFT_258805 [Infundibulicybe gibba]
MSRFVNEKISFNNSTFNQVAGNLHDGDVTHVYGRLVNSNNYNSNNVTGSGNVIGSNNTSSSRVHPYREYYDAGWRYRHHRYGGPEQRPSHQRAQGMRVRGSRRGRQSTAESSQSEEYYTASESGSEEGECSPPYKVQQPPQQAASSDPPLNFHGSSAYRSHRGEASTCAPSRSSSRATRSSSNQPLTQIRTLHHNTGRVLIHRMKVMNPLAITRARQAKMGRHRGAPPARLAEMNGKQSGLSSRIEMSDLDRGLPLMISGMACRTLK